MIPGVLSICCGLQKRRKVGIYMQLMFNAIGGASYIFFVQTNKKGQDRESLDEKKLT